MADFAHLESPNLISRKIRVAGKSWNFHTVVNIPVNKFCDHTGHKHSPICFYLRGNSWCAISKHGHLFSIFHSACKVHHWPNVGIFCDCFVCINFQIFQNNRQLNMELAKNLERCVLHPCVESNYRDPWSEICTIHMHRMGISQQWFHWSLWNKIEHFRTISQVFCEICHNE